MLGFKQSAGMINPNTISHAKPLSTESDHPTFSVLTEFTAATGKPRGMPLVAQELQASRRGNQWHPRV
jgi:hypothetical protein